jgi:predicted RNA methylase
VLATVPAVTVEGRVMTTQPTQRWRAPVLDPCLGSGTTAVACALLDRSCVGFELDEGWADRADKRAQAALKGELSDRDRERAERWVMATLEAASSVPFPKAADGSDVKTWERAQRRLHDAHRVAAKLL